MRVAQALAARLQSEELIANVEYGYENLRTTVLEKLAPYGPRFVVSANAPERLPPNTVKSWAKVTTCRPSIFP